MAPSPAGCSGCSSATGPRPALPPAEADERPSPGRTLLARGQEPVSSRWHGLATGVRASSDEARTAPGSGLLPRSSEGEGAIVAPSVQASGQIRWEAAGPPMLYGDATRA